MSTLVDAAWNIAKTERRYRDKGDDIGADHAHARMMAVVDRTGDPEQVLQELVERLGRLDALRS